MNRSAGSYVDVESEFRSCERYLWGICYRMTGCAADADDLVQDTFRRAIERPPEDTGRAWRPWLVRVAMNLSRDHLRKRKRRGYTGSWLPSPVEHDVACREDSERGAASRYEQMESVSFAFLVALEELTPKRRAVLLLRDVFDYSVAETADLLEMTESNVKTCLHRARKQMASYDDRPIGVGPELEAATAAALQALMLALASGQHERFAALLAEDVRAISDGGGQYTAAGRPLVGRDEVTRFMFGLLKLRGAPSRMTVRVVNGLPAVIVEFDGATGRDAPRALTRIDIDASGAVHSIHSVLAARKLTAIAGLES